MTSFEHRLAAPKTLEISVLTQPQLNNKTRPIYSNYVRILICYVFSLFAVVLT